MLGQIRDQVRNRGIAGALASRAAVLGTCVDSLLARVDTTAIPRSTIESVLRALAWQIQVKRPLESDAASAATLLRPDVDQIIVNSRGAGDFSITDMRKALVGSDLIAQNVEGDVRFPSDPIRSFLAARYLAARPRPDSEIDNLAATFGRIGRLRYWRDTFIIAAALPEFAPYRAKMLESVLTGSSMLEGEQVFLAARLYVEMSSNKPDEPGFNSTVSQIVDSLVWRARDYAGRPQDDRRMAIAHLGNMRHPAAVPHLIRMAVDKVRAATPGDAGFDRYEFAGLRFLAMDGLWQQVNATLDEVAKRPDAAALQEVIGAWKVMYEDPRNSDQMMRILSADEPHRSPIAAFALMQFGPDVIADKLLPLYRDVLRNRELLWCITEGLATMDGDWLAERIIDPAIGGQWDRTRTVDDLRTMLCFLIQALGDAPPGSPRRTYIERTVLGDTNVDSRVWALRALARLRIADDSGGEDDCANPRRMAHAILTENRQILTECKIEPNHDWKVAALDALRDVGDEESIDLIRGIRLQLDDSALLTLSFQVAEEIYWRRTGGMIQPRT
jgi:hypothetical protein